MDDGAGNDGPSPLTSDDEVDGSSDLPGEAGLDSPFWDLLLFAVICAVGAGVTVALRRQPLVVVVIVLGVIVGTVAFASRRADRRWTLRDYVRFTGFVIIAMGFGPWRSSSCGCRSARASCGEF